MSVLLSARPFASRLVVLLSLLLCRLPMAALAQSDTPNTDAVSRDDCEIISKVMTSQHANPLSFASFGAACDWQKLGLTVPTTTATTGWRAFFGKPRYDTDRKRATVSYSNSYNGTNGMYGSHQFDCRGEKLHGHWEIPGCSAGVIAN